MLVVMSHIIGKAFDFGGECGVSFFFVLSGFVLSYAYGEKVRDGSSLFWVVSPVFLFVYITTDKVTALVTAFLHHPFMLWLGSISFEIYLTHFVTLRILNSILNSLGVYSAELPGMAVTCMEVVMIVLVSYVVKKCYVDKVYSALEKVVLR